MEFSAIDKNFERDWKDFGARGLRGELVMVTWPCAKSAITLLEFVVLCAANGVLLVHI
jgi:hypothetical protein